MSNQLEQARAMVKQVCHAYLSKQDTSEVLHHADHQIVWIANEINQICRGWAELRVLLQENEQHVVEPYKIIKEWYEAIPIAADTCIVYGEVKLDDKLARTLTRMTCIRISVICKLGEQALKMLHVHTSIGGQGIKDDQYHPSLIAQDNATDRLQQVIMEKTVELERVYEEYREVLSRYKFTLEVTNDVVFELDLDSKQILVDERRFYELFQMIPKQGFCVDMKEEMLSHIHPEDRERVDTIFGIPHIIAMGLEGNEIISCEYRFQKYDKDYIWILGQMTPIKDAQGRGVKLIFNFKNIDEQVRRENEMKQLSQKDSLTGLLNKAGTEAAVTSCIDHAKEEEGGALFIIDIDNFKDINDNMGYLYGDAVLSYFAAELTHLLHATDIVGRVGGDEFLVFMLGSPSIDVIEAKAAMICKIFRDSVMKEQQNDKASCSLGIALFPEQGCTYYDLFKKADDALCEAKKRGNDQYCFY